jgi:hypothetical protein
MDASSAAIIIRLIWSFWDKFQYAIVLAGLIIMIHLLFRRILLSIDDIKRRLGYLCQLWLITA